MKKSPLHLTLEVLMEDHFPSHVTLKVVEPRGIDDDYFEVIVVDDGESPPVLGAFKLSGKMLRMMVHEQGSIVYLLDDLLRQLAEEMGFWS